MLLCQALTDCRLVYASCSLQQSCALATADALDALKRAPGAIVVCSARFPAAGRYKLNRT